MLPQFEMPKFELPKVSFSFEQLVGGKLPIWVGGIALVLAAFFLVRYSIEQGMLGPRVRTIMAAVFGIALTVASEAARRIPRFAEDPRVGQSLAGAGIASLYGTLYMAAQTYQFITPTTAFILMAIVTAAALFLSLRHGPPTAIMGLIGGFTAPFMAAPSGNLVPLLVYLGLLIAGLFAVAIQRGWMWLALAATGGGIVWSLGILAADLTGIGPSLGLFIVVLALAATMLFPRTGKNDPRIRLLPMVAGFIQLALFAPAIDFGPSGWALYGLLSAASLYLGHRDERLMPASLAALGLVLILLFAAFVQNKPDVVWAVIGATALFAIPGHIFARAGGQTRLHWAVLALAGGAGPLFAAWIAERGLLGQTGWGLLFAVAALPPALLSWRARDDGREGLPPDWALAGGGTLAGLLAFVSAWSLVPELWVGSAGLAIALAVAVWAKRVGDKALFGASIAFAAGGFAFWLTSFVVRPGVAEAIFFNGAVPPAEHILALLALPAALSGLIAWAHRARLADHPLRWIGLALALAVPLALVPALWHPAVCTGGAAVLGAWARQSEDRFRFHAGLVMVVPAALFWAGQMLVHFDVPEAVFANGAVPPALKLIALLVVPALLLAFASWCHRGKITREALRWYALLPAAMLPLALVPALWHASALLGVAVALGLWLKLREDRFAERASLVTMIGGLLFALAQIGLRPEFAQSIFSNGAAPAAEPLIALLGVPAVLIAALAWAHGGRIAQAALKWLTLAALTMLVLALVPYLWQPAALALTFALLVLAGARLAAPSYAAEALLVATVLWSLEWALPYLRILAGSFVGERLHYARLGDTVETLIATGLPAALLALAWLRGELGKRLELVVSILAGLGAVACAYGLAKQPLAIASDAQFVAWGFIERVAITQALAIAGVALLWRGADWLRSVAFALLGIAALRLVAFDLVLLNPLLVKQWVGTIILLNAATIHFELAALWVWLVGQKLEPGRAGRALSLIALPLAAGAAAITVRQAFQGTTLDGLSMGDGETYAYSGALLLLSIVWLWRGIASGRRWLRMAGLVLLTLVTLKVFLIDAAALEGLLRVFSFLGLGLSLMGIGWVYGRLLNRKTEPA